MHSRSRWLIGLTCALTVMALASPATADAVDQGAPAYYDSGVARTPYMGWNTYYGLGAPDETKVKSVADFLVSSGLRRAGYDIVWIDGGWTAPQPRDASGNLLADPAKFPGGIANLVTYLHRKGLRAGIYTDAGASDGKNCAAGSGGHYAQDTKRFASWKFDAVKVDFLCGIAQNLKPAEAFGQFSAALRQAGRPMILNACNPVTDEWGVPHGPDQVAGVSYAFGPLVADSWRTDTDIAFGTPYEGIWRDVLRNMDNNAAHPEANGPGHYNDPDYLIPMRKTEQGTYELNEEESTSQLVMWAEMASPLIIGSDPRTLPTSMIDTLKNPEIIAVDQDPLGIQGVRVAPDTYSKVLTGKGNRAVVLLNRGSAAAQLTVNFADAGLKGTVSVRDLRTRTDKGTATGSYTATVPAHGTAFLRLHGTDLVPGTDLGGGATASPAIVALDGDRTMVFTRGQNDSLKAKTDGSWQDLGGSILGQPAAYASGQDVDVVVRGKDNAAYRRTLHNGRWGGWVRLGGQLTDAPAVTTDGILYARGADGKLWSRAKNGDWESLGAPNDKPFYGRPGAAGDQVAVRAADDSVWAWSRATGWQRLGGVVSGSPTLVSTLGRTYLFARASDYTIWQTNRADGGWGGWFKRTEFASNAVVGALGATAGPDGSALVAVRGPDGHIYRTKL